jgi:hypothetical protein
VEITALGPGSVVKLCQIAPHSVVETSGLVVYDTLHIAICFLRFYSYINLQ